MLKARNLDDQTYEEIVQAAEVRLPWLCPVWTDHNAHDPGITILELMAWYKELQQYHMNQFTDELRCKLLKLAGITRRPAVPARCAVELGPEAPERLAGAGGDPLRAGRGGPRPAAGAGPDPRGPGEPEPGRGGAAGGPGHHLPALCPGGRGMFCPAYRAVPAGRGGPASVV